MLIVDDHDLLTESLGAVLEHEPDLDVVGVAGSLARARELVVTAAPDVVLLDQELPDGLGIPEIRRLRSLRPEMAVVVLTCHTEDRLLVDAIDAGAAGFLCKTNGVAEVTSAVRAAARGESVISPSMLSRLLPRLRRGDDDLDEQHLTFREQEVLGLLADGMSNAAIAQTLTLSVNTVRNHVSHLSAKLGAHSKLEALSIAVRDGMLPER